MSISVLNTNANLSGKTIMAAENADTITGLKTFNRGAAAPFAVDAASTKVANLAVDYAAAPLNGQFAFPAVQNPSAGANVLDDYEENTFVPTITSTGGGVPTYNIQAGGYTKIGRQVFFTCRVSISAFGTLAAGSVAVSGLPFTALNAANNFHSICVGFWNNLTTPAVNVTAYLTPNTTAVSLNIVTAAAGGVTLMSKADISATFDVIITGSYYV